ncbi:hypothetical protein [Halorubrum yunnanense]|uniref:Site-specific integrase n=1 Tax=Halorubrum yunnanense TaxID=1526162 RepID=A0ABD5YJ33_9EURY|nr:hypothetical protein [Halorubrum yunnanense]
MTELGDDTQAAMCYPSSRQYEQWKTRAEERGYDSVSRFIIDMVEAGSKQMDISVEDVALSHPSIKKWYPSLGTAAAVSDYENALYIPSREEREGNKSHRSRILPLDDEAKRVLIQFLQTRPSVDSQYLIVSERTYEPMDDSEHISAVWKDHFEAINRAPEFEDYRSIRSHYGRNFFTNYWKIQQDIPRELVQYMRGDKLGKSTSGEAIDDYLAAYYEDIRDLYLDCVFKLL